MQGYETEPMDLDFPEVAFAADVYEENILGSDVEEDAFSFDDAAAAGLAFGADAELGYMLGWSPFKAIKSAVKSVGKTVSKVAKKGSKLGKALVNSKLVKATVAGAAIVFPPVGVPAAAAMAVATGVVAATKSKNPQQRAAAVKSVKATAALADKGDKPAQVALATMSNVALAAKARAAAAKKPAPKPAIKAPVRTSPLATVRRWDQPATPKPTNVKHRIVVDVLPSGYLSTTRV